MFGFIDRKGCGWYYNDALFNKHSINGAEKILDIMLPTVFLASYIKGIFEALFKNELQIADDIAVIGFDDM